MIIYYLVLIPVQLVLFDNFLKIQIMDEERKIVKVTLKWGSQKYNDVPLELSQPLSKFRKLLREMTNVNEGKQKIIYKGQTLKDDQDLLKLVIQDGAQVMLMGQAEEHQIKMVKEETKFIEELTPEERARLLKERQGIILPVGLKNLGNTCYLNSSIQCLRRVNELKNFLLKNKPQNADIKSRELFRVASKLFHQLEAKGEGFKPVEFVSIFMQIFPQFNEREQSGAFKQQDADECFSNILETILPCAIYENGQGEQRNLIRDLFEINYEVTLKNQDMDEEASISFETNRKLMCIIDNENNPVNTLVDGIRVSLTGQVEKLGSDNLNHVYTKTQKIDHLPSYLLVQMVRFFWKQGGDGKEGTKSKILRQVSFPKILDVFDFCSEKLQKNLTTGREYEKKQLSDNVKLDSDKFEQYKKDFEAKGQTLPDDTREIYKKFKEAQKEQDIKNHDEQLYREHGFGLETGSYQVVGVLTHKGRLADSGHYVAWTHDTGEEWLCYDDDVVSEVKTEQILELRGGGDWHMGYYLIYRKIEVQ